MPRTLGLDLRVSIPDRGGDSDGNGNGDDGDGADPDVVTPRRSQRLSARDRRVESLRARMTAGSGGAYGGAALPSPVLEMESPSAYDRMFGIGGFVSDDLAGAGPSVEDRSKISSQLADVGALTGTTSATATPAVPHRQTGRPKHRRGRPKRPAIRVGPPAGSAGNAAARQGQPSTPVVLSMLEQMGAPSLEGGLLTPSIKDGSRSFNIALNEAAAEDPPMRRSSRRKRTAGAVEAADAALNEPGPNDGGDTDSRPPAGKRPRQKSPTPPASPKDDAKPARSSRSARRATAAPAAVALAPVPAFTADPDESSSCSLSDDFDDLLMGGGGGGGEGAAPSAPAMAATPPDYDGDDVGNGAALGSDPVGAVVTRSSRKRIASPLPPQSVRRAKRQKKAAAGDGSADSGSAVDGSDNGHPPAGKRPRPPNAGTAGKKPRANNDADSDEHGGDPPEAATAAPVVKVGMPSRRRGRPKRLPQRGGRPAPPSLAGIGGSAKARGSLRQSSGSSSASLEVEDELRAASGAPARTKAASPKKKVSRAKKAAPTVSAANQPAANPSPATKKQKATKQKAASKKSSSSRKASQKASPKSKKKPGAKTSAKASKRTARRRSARSGGGGGGDGDDDVAGAAGQGSASNAGSSSASSSSSSSASHSSSSSSSDRKAKKKAKKAEKKAEKKAAKKAKKAAKKAKKRAKRIAKRKAKADAALAALGDSGDAPGRPRAKVRFLRGSALDTVPSRGGGALAIAKLLASRGDDECHSKGKLLKTDAEAAKKESDQARAADLYFKAAVCFLAQCAAADVNKAMRLYDGPFFFFFFFFFCTDL